MADVTSSHECNHEERPHEGVGSAARTATTKVFPVKPTTVRSITLDLRCFSLPCSEVAHLDCRECGSSLDIHQPDPGRPDRLLATCPECGHWYRVDTKPGGGRAQVIQFPEPIQVRGTADRPRERA